MIGFRTPPVVANRARRPATAFVVFLWTMCATLHATAASSDAQPPIDDQRSSVGAPGNTETDSRTGEIPPTARFPTHAELEGRERYNAALSELGEAALDDARASFLIARDSAGPDQALRYRAAFNLGMTTAQQADAAMSEPETALAALRESAAWFNDAVRLGPEGDDDARVNLEIVMRRILELVDQQGAGNRLEARLDRIIEDQRGTRDQVRQLVTEIRAAGAAEEPLSFQRGFESLAARQRVLLAEASAIAELAADEAHALSARDDALTDEERVRLFQLESMDRFLNQARQALADARRRLRQLDGGRAHRRADAALSELKRAREQLDDPIKVLKAVAHDELGLLESSAKLADWSSHSFRPLAEAADSTRADGAPPAWLTSDHLADRQENAAMRTGETLMRLEAGVGDDALPTDAQTADPAAEQVRRAAAEAIPLLDDARGAMRTAIKQLQDEAWSRAGERQATALMALHRAIERFAGLKDLIELAYADQTRLLGWLAADREAAAPDWTELSEAANGLVSDNLDRMMRLEQLIIIERETAAAAQSEADQSDPAAAAERYEQAETLRLAAVAALQSLAAEVRGNVPGAAATGHASNAHAQLQALRRLFFTIVEHLHDLLTQQTETHDAAASSVDAPIDTLSAALGAVGERQTRHAAVADAIAAALESQADAAAAEPSAANGAVDFGQAVTEVRAANGRMQTAALDAAEAAAQSATMSPVLEPLLEDQVAAMDHLATAIRLLQPPSQPNPDQGSEQQQQQAQQGQPSSDEQQQPMSERQALRRLQAIRDRDAERQRERERGTAQRDPVEKDW